MQFMILDQKKITFFAEWTLAQLAKFKVYRLYVSILLVFISRFYACTMVIKENVLGFLEMHIETLSSKEALPVQFILKTVQEKNYVCMFTCMYEGK